VSLSRSGDVGGDPVTSAPLGLSWRLPETSLTRSFFIYQSIHNHTSSPEDYSSSRLVSSCLLDFSLCDTAFFFLS
jgi:hypothetical protein